MKRITTAVTVLLLLASFAAAPAVAQNEAYAGSHVSFGTSANAVTDYAVDGETMLSAVKVQSAGEAEGRGLVDGSGSLSSVSSIEGTGLSLSAQTETSATVQTEGSASMDAHDNANGVLVVRSGGERQYVQADLSDGTEASAAGDGRVTVTTADGVEGAFVVTGDGDVAVNEEGGVTARLGEDSRLVFRAYPDGRSDDDVAEEQLIADGRAAGEVHVMSEGGETVTDTVSYGSDTNIEVSQQARGQVEVRVDRAAHEGQVVITSVSKSAMDASNDLTVQVDGEAAVEASSYSELQGAIGSDQSKYLVRSSSNAEASADVLVAVNHFSERTITMQESSGSASGDADATATDPGSSSDGSDGSSGANSTPGQPGFGVLATVLAVLAVALVAVRRR